MKLNSQYKLLPFRFFRMDKKILLVNEVGEYYFIDEIPFKKLIKHQPLNNLDLLRDLKSRFFIADSNLHEYIELLAIKYRTKKSFLYDFTSLHIIVLTLRCNHKCDYCHVASISSYDRQFDMDIATAKNCVNTILNSPSNSIKIEFQGGEPLLNFETLKYIVEYTNEKNTQINKNIEYVISTNLTTLTPYQFDYIKKNNILISTSLDGPENIHNHHRKLINGKNSYQIVKEKLQWLIDEGYGSNISALMTTTSDSLTNIKKIVDEYIKLKLRNIFIRDMNYFGRAKINYENLKYSIFSFVKAYKEAFNYILELNKSGIYFREVYASILLKKILTPYSTGFVDLQSPSGAGISVAVYNYNGDVFVSDEARMLYPKGSNLFKLGNVNIDDFQTIFNSKKLKYIVSRTTISALPKCAFCVFMPYCGIDPIRNYDKYGTIDGSRISDRNCYKNRELFKFLFNFIGNNDEDIINIFWSWLSNKAISEIMITN